MISIIYSGQSLSKKYLYHDHLQFLLKIIEIEKDQMASSIEETVPDYIKNNLESPKLIGDSSDSKILFNKNNRGCKCNLDEELDREILKSLQDNKPSLA